MKRIYLTDGSARFFNAESAELFEEMSYHDGHNFISKATGSQWEHESLYRSAGGCWFKHSWSQWQGSVPSVVCIDDIEATEWFLNQGLETPECLGDLDSSYEIK